MVDINQIKEAFTDLVFLDIEGKSAKEVLSNIANLLNEVGLIKDKELFYSQLLTMQQDAITLNPGKSVAFPEQYEIPINRAYAFILCRTKNAILFDSPLVSKPSNIILITIGAEKELRAPMARLMKILKEGTFCDAFLLAKTKEDVYDLFKKESLK
jgi:mannitol/fructose-specific phosphotransferase system IIA component (Ntr-type)